MKYANAISRNYQALRLYAINGCEYAQTSLVFFKITRANFKQIRLFVKVNRSILK
jgi:hypothetical protein